MIHNIFLFVSVFLVASSTYSQMSDYSPYSSFDDNSNVLTLSNGKYNEFFDTDTLEIIGSAILNTKTKKIIGFVNEEQMDAQLNKEIESSHRFLSIDPLASKYPANGPYNFSENVVINAVELEGLERNYTFNSNHTTEKFLDIYSEFQKGTKTFDEVTKYLDSRTGYRMGDGQRDEVRGRLSKGKDIDYLGLDKKSGVPFIATDKDIANNNYIIVRVILPTKDGSYDRESFQIVRDGYAPDIGLTMEQVRNSGYYDPMEGGEAPPLVKGLVGIIPIVTVTDFIHMMVYDENIYGESVDKDDKVWGGVTVVAPIAGKAISTGIDILDFVQTVFGSDGGTEVPTVVKEEQNSSSTETVVKQKPSFY